MPFQMRIIMRITEDGKEFSETDQTYSNMDYNDMQTCQATIIDGLVALGNAGLTKKAD